MTRNNARDSRDWSWVLSIPSDESGWITASRCHDEHPFDLQVRVGSSPNGRLFVTGLRIGAPDGTEPYEIHNLRHLHLGEILAQIREAAALGGGKALGPDLRGNVRPAAMTVRRGPEVDPVPDEYTLRLYEQIVAESPDMSKTEAVYELATRLNRSASQIYRRLTRARKAREKEANEQEHIPTSQAPDKEGDERE